MSNPSSKLKDGTFTVIRPRFLCEDMGHDSSSSVAGKHVPLHVEPINSKALSRNM
jgi:hypothetical protein